MSASFQEARYALKIIQYLSGKKCINYSNLGIYGLLSHVDDKAILKYFYQSKLKQLLNEEITLMNDSLLNTLKYYLLSQNNVSKTARMIFMHRNTVMYRLKKIQEALEVDLSDPNTCFELYLAIIIKELIDKEV